MDVFNPFSPLYSLWSQYAEHNKQWVGGISGAYSCAVIELRATTCSTAATARVSLLYPLESETVAGSTWWLTSNRTISQSIQLVTRRTTRSRQEWRGSAKRAPPRYGTNWQLSMHASAWKSWSRLSVKYSCAQSRFHRRIIMLISFSLVTFYALLITTYQFSLSLFLHVIMHGACWKFVTRCSYIESLEVRYTQLINKFS